MKQNTAIIAHNISKQYRLGEVGTGTLSHDLNRAWAKLRGKEDPFLKIGERNDRSTKGGSDYVWSLKDINFEIEKGDAVGIIGRNGAGKSTLLKLLSRVTKPTTGHFEVQGRIASLLEVGTGFNPEMTGRENIFLNGAILGMRRQEIKRKFDEIVDFAAVERYIDTPVKRYSSGMYVRLAFAVAAHLESEILIVDEVLAVGDAEFQKKCLGKMGDVSKGEGRTVLFVSHNMDAILRLCNKSLYLSNGTIVESGDTNTIVTNYLNSEINSTSSRTWKMEDQPGNDYVRLSQVEVVSNKKIEKLNFHITEKIGIKINFKILQNASNVVIGFNLFNHLEDHILSSHDTTNQNFNYTPGNYETIMWIPENLLAEGLYTCSVALMSYNPFEVICHELEVVTFNIVDMIDGSSARGAYTGKFPGIIRPHLDWEKTNVIY